VALVGLKDLHYALLITDAGSTTYGAVKPIAGAISASIDPAVNTSTLYADDGPDEVASALGEITVELQIKDLPLDIQSALLGHETPSGGVVIKKASDAAPYVAIGFKSLKSTGKYRYVWLYKGKFQLPEENYKTKEENVEFQTPTITGKFVKRISDGNWMSMGDEDDTGFTSGATWFNAVA
jgi:phi13 family phage major tail protein